MTKGSYVSRMTGTQRLAINGTHLAVDVEGEGPAVLFIHGYPLDRTIWEHQVAHLDGWRRIAPDLRGMGESDAPGGDYGMATYSADLAALLDELGVERTVLCGLSMGGYVALDFLRRWPARVSGLILMDTRAEADTAEGRQGRDAAIQVARQSGAEAIAEGMLPKILADGASPDMEDRVGAMMAATPVAGIIGALEAMKSRSDSTPMLRTIGVPTLVIVGEDDAITPPEQARVMARAIPGARLLIVSDAGHLPPVERPEVTTEALRDFLRSVPNG